VLFTPKSLLRHPRAAVSIGDLADGSFQPVLDDPRGLRRDEVRRIVFVTGKVGIDALDAAERDGDHGRTALVRVELLYPFPSRDVRHVLERYPAASQYIWLQEEPMNMGAWNYVEPRLRELLPADVPLRYVGRPIRASTAEGSAAAHAREQARIIGEALDLNDETTEREERGVQHVR
jgi:2-oxoglutarate dehydrogenase E1 component